MKLTEKGKSTVVKPTEGMTEWLPDELDESGLHHSMKDKRILIVGGTGSLGHELIRYLHNSNELAIFSRDEEKQWKIKIRHPDDRIKCIIGDIRDYDSIYSALQLYQPEIIINAAALKQITACEYHPFESFKTNVLGVQNLVDAVNRAGTVETVIGISTDKACQPVNVYGICKSLQERVYVRANLFHGKTRFLCVRYGNVLESRGSVIPLFQQQIEQGGPVTITIPEMTRFLLTLRQSVKLIMMAHRYGLPGDTWIPKTCSTTVQNIADALIQGRNIPIKQIGIRPGEKVHETLISEEEVFRTIAFNNHFVIEPILPELNHQHSEREGEAHPVTFHRYSSDDCTVDKAALEKLLRANQVIP